MAITAPVPLEFSQQIRIFNRLLRQETQLVDIFEPLTSPTTIVSSASNRKGMMVPEGCFARLEGHDVTARYEQFGMVNGLSNEPTEGTVAGLLGAEEPIQTKYSEAFSTDVTHGVPLEEWGLEALAKSGYKINEQAVALLKNWKAQLVGRYKRNSLLEIFSYNLMFPPHNFANIFSPNFHIFGLGDAAQLTYADQASAAWSNAIATAITTAGTGAAAQITVNNLIRAEYNAINNHYLQPTNIAGKEGYPTIIPENQMAYFKRISQGGSAGNVYLLQAATDKEIMEYPGAVGWFGKLFLMADPRWPTLTIGGSAGNYTLTARYRGMGRGAGSDPRDMTVNARDIGWILSPGAVVEKPDQDWHLETNWEPYDKTYGLAIAATVGWNQVRYKTGLTTAPVTIQQDSSMVLVMAKPPVAWDVP